MRKVFTFLQNYKWELLTFGAIFTVLLVDCTPDYTWINTDCDGIHYVYSAKYLYPAHKTSAPLFLLIGYLFLKLPFGLEAWRMSLMSVFASTASVVFIYLIIKNHTDRRFYAIIGSLVFGSSALVISQSTIVETYALVTMFGIGAFYFAIKKQWFRTAIMLGLGGAVHHLIGFPILVLLIANKEFRNWKYVGTMTCFLLFYLYIPLTVAFNQAPDMWGNIGSDFFSDNLSTAIMLIGGLSIWDFPKRVLDTVGILGVSLGVALVPIAIFSVKRGWYKEPLTWLFILPVIYHCTNLAPQTYVYMMPSIAFGAVIAGVGLAKMRPYWRHVVLAGAVIALIINANYFDIGRTLDPELSARKYYSEELTKVPDGQILVAHQGWEWAAVFKYNKEYDRNILAVCTGTLLSPRYRQELESMGVKYHSFPNTIVRYTTNSRINYVTHSIIDLNEDVWMTRKTNTRTYGAEIIKATTEDFRYEGAVPITDGSMDMQWRWKPSNPYDIITGAIEVEEWYSIVFSNYNILTFTMLGTIGAIPLWVLYMFLIKRKRWRLKRGVISND